jgi:apolipoprotein N-acyltransferase
MHLAGCGRFWLWSLAGALVTFALLAAASIGIFVLPFAVLVLFFLSRRTRDRAELLGALVGAGAVCAAIAWIQREPGGFDASHWLLAAVVLAVAGIAGYALLGRRPAPRA